ncbi:hypothetical protein PIB30_093148, partial [Stylosanthes scabra]|nr:hypothetical protein [Stylosanthes scabra]
DCIARTYLVHYFQEIVILVPICRLLKNNAISDQIPAAIGKLKKLEPLDLSNNAFRGEIPSSLGGLTSLNYL